MPLYDFKCLSCGLVTSHNLSVSARNTQQDCEDCGGEMERVVSKPGVHFKGHGWTPKFGSR